MSLVTSTPTKCTTGRERSPPARLPMPSARVLAPSADVLEALARVLTVQADGREDQFHREPRKIHERRPVSSFIILPSLFPQKCQRRGIFVEPYPKKNQPQRGGIAGRCRTYGAWLNG